ncbi:MAG: glycoside hydrolase family 3 C-terminal domain-containing protein, partial [Proteiniphilum sp.]|nr:glycoside hydrolase family 3 C-terminal domain-containing protein [Proteiniphilum sp.]
MRKILILLGLVLFLSSCAQKDKKYPFQNSSLSTDTRVEDLLSRLTVEEKVSLMMNESPAIERLGIPAYDWWNEALHGVARAGRATVFPQAIAMAATFDDQAVYETFEIISDEARAKYHNYQKNKEYDRYRGLSFWTPNINIFRDPRWGRGMETYGEDPYLTSRMGVAVVKGLQGDDPKYFKTLACAKHFAVHSGPEWSRHSLNVSVSARDLLETYLPAFEDLVKEANVQQVMCAYNRLDGEPCCSSKKLLNVTLRKEWGYQGITVSDCGAISDFWIKDPVVKRHETHADATEASVDAVRSGTDLECGRNYESLVKAIKSDIISEKEIDVSLRRLLTGRFKLGMFDPDDQVKWSKIPYSVVDSEKHKEKALEMARKSIVLLRNINNTLPLSKSIKKIAVVGPNANDSTMLWGNYNGFPSSTVTILEGIRHKVPGAEVIYEKGCELTKSDSVDQKRIDFKATAEKVKDAEVIVFIGGISPSLEGEEMPVDAPGFKKGDRTDIELPAVQLELLKTLKKTGKPIVFILCTGSAIALNWENENLDAIVNGWYGGQAAGTAIADVIFGDYNPAGRLPVTFYRSVNQLSDFEDYSMKGRTYRYMTAEPLYPFGYGLRYSKFKYSDISLSKSEIDLNSSVMLNVSVENDSKYDGDEVVQVYIKRVEDKEGPILTLK